MKIEIGTNEAGQRLDKFLRKLLKDVPLSKIFKALRKGDIRVNGKKQKENYTLLVDDVVEIKYIQSNKEKPEDKFIKVDASGMKITYEDANILVVEKWPNILVHPDAKGKEPSLTDYVLSYLNEKGDYLPENEVTFTPASCNRLDRNTSGIVIFGKNFEALRSVNELIREGNVEKYYNTLVKGKIKDGLYKGYIHKNEDDEVIVNQLEEKKVIPSLYDSLKLGTNDKYGVFLGGNKPIIKIQTTAKYNNKLLLIKDSYANSIVQFLTPYFEEIVMVDPRYYYGNIEELIKEGKFSEILFLYNANTFFQDNSLYGVLENY